MTIHIDLSKSETTLAEVIDLARAGQTIVIDLEGKRLGELVFEPSDGSVLARAKVKHPFIGAWAHLGPFSDEFLDSFVEPDPEFDPDKSLFPE